MMTKTSAPMYTDSEALDEAVLLLTRKLRRLAPAEHAKICAQLPDGARTALSVAEMRAAIVRDSDKKAGIALCTRPYPDPWAADEAEDQDDDDTE